MNITTLSKKIVDVVITATKRDGTPVAVSTVQVALVPPNAVPTASTTWNSTTVANNIATFTLAGVDADPTGAIVVSSGGADLWVKVVDAPESDLVRVGRIKVL